MQPSLAMLMKTNVEKMAFCRLLAMLMKRIELKSLSRDVGEKKGSWLKPEVENGEGACAKDRSGFVPRLLQPCGGGPASMTRRCAGAGRGSDNNPHAWRCGPRRRSSRRRLATAATASI